MYKLKRNTNDSIDRFKARIVARGFKQEHGIDYWETFSPVVRFTSVRAILAIAAKQKLCIKQFDGKTAFLYGELQENVYVYQPKGFDDGSGRVYKLNKSLFGLKQASRCWNEKFTSFIKQFGFTACESDPCVFVSNKNGNLIILAIYVDDGLLVGTSEASINSVIKHLQTEFESSRWTSVAFWECKWVNFHQSRGVCSKGHPKISNGRKSSIGCAERSKSKFVQF